MISGTPQCKHCTQLMICLNGTDFVCNNPECDIIELTIEMQFSILEPIHAVVDEALLNIKNKDSKDKITWEGEEQ